MDAPALNQICFSAASHLIFHVDMGHHHLLGPTRAPTYSKSTRMDCDLRSAKGIFVKGRVHDIPRHTERKETLLANTYRV